MKIIPVQPTDRPTVRRLFGSTTQSLRTWTARALARRRPEPRRARSVRVRLRRLSLLLLGPAALVATTAVPAAAATAASYVNTAWPAAGDWATSGVVPPQKLFVSCDATSHTLSVAMSTFNYVNSLGGVVNAPHSVSWNVWVRPKGGASWIFVRSGTTDYNGYVSWSDPNNPGWPYEYNVEAQVIGSASYGFPAVTPGATYTGVAGRYYDVAATLTYRVNGTRYGSTNASALSFTQRISSVWPAQQTSTCSL